MHGVGRQKPDEFFSEESPALRGLSSFLLLCGSPLVHIPLVSHSLLKQERSAE